VQEFLNLLVSGAVSGAIYSLVAAGLVLSYNATGIFNLGFGAIAYTTAFFYFQLNTGLDWPIVPAALVSVLLFAPLLVLVAVPALAKWIVELLINHTDLGLSLGNNVFITPGVGPSPKKNWILPGDILLDSNQLIVFITAAVCAIGLWALMRHTNLGLRLRAVVDRPELARMRAVDPARSSAIAWMLGTGLAGLAGVVGAPVFNSLDSATYTLIMFVAVAAAVVGGLRSIPIAFAGGLALGVLQNLVTRYATFAADIRGFNAAVPFVVLFIGLIVASRDRGRRAGSVSDDPPPPDITAVMPLWRRVLPLYIGLAVVGLFACLVLGDFWLGLTVRGLAFGLVFLSFVIVTGMGGMVSLAQAAFVTASALTTGLLINRYDVPFVIAVLGGIAVAVALGALVALPALRLGGLPLALSTLALAFVGERVLFNWSWFRNQQEGWAINRPELGPLDLGSDRQLAVFLLVLIALVAVVIINIQRSQSGRAIAAVRSAEAAAATSGVSPTSVKLMLFMLSASVAALGGAMVATFDQRATDSAFPAVIGLVWLATVVLWGVRRPAAAVIAGLSVTLFPALLTNGFTLPSFLGSASWSGTTSAFIPDILFGLGAIQMAKDPDGILSLMFAGRARRQARREQEEAAALQAAEEQAIAAEIDSHERAMEARGVVHAAPAAVTDDLDLSSAMLRMSDLRAGYGDVPVLFGVDLALLPGSITALVGANGAGKSTLCNVIGGLVPVTSGRVELAGDDVTRLPAHLRARRDLVVVPESRGVFPSLTVDDNLSMWLHTAAERDQVYERFGALAERRSTAAGNLSGGEQQLLSLAPILVRPPKVLVVDEPTLGLAPLVVERLLGLFEELRASGVALLLVEEKAKAVLGVADRVTFFELGHVLWSGPRADVDDALLAETYLGSAAPASAKAAAPASVPAPAPGPVVP
jgi:ABC-type branched-subunit amino acid transport system ATPase component/branched-subunit amino acid ABC-type transport system permease component